MYVRSSRTRHQHRQGFFLLSHFDDFLSLPFGIYFSLPLLDYTNSMAWVFLRWFRWCLTSWAMCRTFALNHDNHWPPPTSKSSPPTHPRPFQEIHHACHHRYICGGLKCKNIVVIAANSLASHGSLTRFTDTKRLPSFQDTSVVGLSVLGRI